MTRRLIAGLLTLCMLVSLCPPNAFALRSSAAVVPETESTVVEPAAEEPKVEEPAAEEPKAEEPAAEEPAAEEPQTEDTQDTPAEDPAAEDPQTEDPAAEDPKAEEETPKYATVNVNGSVKLTASAEDGGKWASDNIAAATVGAEKADAGEKNVAEVFGVAEGYTTVTYTVGDEEEVWEITVTAAPAEETPAEEEPADVTYSVSRYLEEEAPEGSEAPFTYTLIDTISVTGKPGAEVTLPAVSGAIAVDTDAEDVLPNDDGTATLTLPAETPEEHSLSVFYVKTEARPDISEMDIVNPATKIDTYIFKNGDTVVSTQKIKAGEAVYAPASPEKEGYKFTGWKAGDGSYFTPGVKETVTGGDPYIYTAEFAQVYYVFFLNTEDVVCATKEGISGAEITADVTFPVNADESITGWYTEPALTNKVDSVTIGSANITLYPNVEKGHWITYNSDGGSYTAPVFVHANDVTVAPSDPTRVGYTFQGWYNGDTPFAFGSKLTENVTLTAKWQGNSNTRYTVIHWQENADDNNFSFQESEPMTGTTGAATEASAKSYKGFTAQKIDQQTISGDGSTIVNVYYKRNIYEVKFYKYNNRRPRGWNELTNIRISAKYGANIKDEWPSDVSLIWGTTTLFDNGYEPYQSGISTMPLDGDSFYYVSQSGQYTMNLHYYVQVLGGDTYELDHTDSFKSSNTGWSTSKEDHYPITGFTYTNNLPDGSKFKSDGNNSYSVSFYYDRNSYEIKFINGGSVEETFTRQYEADISDVSYTPTTRPAGIPAQYTFEGWYDNELGQGEEYVFSGKMPAKSITVYAKWAAPTVSGTAYLTMDGVDSAPIQVTYGSTIDESTLPTDEAKAKMPAGYTWRGWATKDEEGNYIPFNFDTRIFSDITLYPYYTSNQSFKVTYNANGGIGTAPSDTKTYADGSYADVMTASNLTAPEGKVFLGWGTEENGGTIYQPGDKIAVHVADITLYAIWGDKAALATLTYNPNGGTGTVTTEKNHLNNESVTLKSDQELGFTRTGYKFLGWSTNSSAATAQYAAGATIIVDNKSPNTLYAVWEKVEFNITYAYTGDVVPNDAPPVPDATKGTVDQKIKVAAAPSVPGYTFSGWTTTTADVTVADDGTFTMPASDVAFTGSWTINQYTVTYKVDGVQVGEVETYDYNAPVTIRDKYVKEGYTVSDWSVTENFSMPARNVEITATTEINQYTVTYKVDGVQVGEVETYDYNAPVTIRDKYVKEGYTVSDWSVTENFNMPARNVEITATTEINQYTVTYKVDGVQVGEVETYDYNAPVTIRDKYVKEGYTVSDWSVTENFNMPARNVEITATTEINQYTVTYKVDGVQVGEVETYDYNAPVTIRDKYVKEGYTVSDWSVTENFNMPARNVEITATTEINQYTVTYKVDGVQVGEVETYDYNAPVTIRDKYVKEGYTVSDWSVTENFNMPARNVEITATTEINQYTVTYKVDGVQVGEVETYDYNAPVTIRDKYVKEGYTVSDWSVTENFSMPARNVEITATTEINQYTVTYKVDGVQVGEVETYDYNAPVTIRDKYVKEGYTVSDWSVTENFNMPARNVEITATTEINQYTVTYKVDGVQVGEVETYDYNAPVTIRDKYVKEGYTVSDWSVTENFSMPARNVEITATTEINQYTVTYKVDGVQVGEVETYDYNAPVTIRDKYVKEGYTVSDWSVTENFSMPARNVEITATTEINQYTVTYKVDGVQVGEVETYDYNAPVTIRDKYVKEGYTVSDWSVTENFNMPARNVEITATTEINQYTVTYKVDGVQVGEVETYDYNAPVTIRDKYVKEGYTVSDWSVTENFNMPARNVEITATTEINQYTVTYKVDGVQVGEVETYDYNAPVTIRDKYVKEGYTVSDWSVTENFNMPARNVEITATTEINQYTVTYKVDGVQVGEVETYDYNAPVTIRDKYVKEGYTVSDWSVTENFNMPARNVEITATTEINQYTVTYKVDGVQVGEVETYDYNAPVTIRDKYVKEGYTVSDWSVTENFNMPARNVEITATTSIRTDLSYTVKYMWDETELDSATRYNRTYNSLSDPEAPIGIEGFTPVSNETQQITIKANNEENVITFYYYKNVELTANSGVRVYNGETQTITGYDAHIDTDKLDLTFDGVTASGSGKDVSATPYEVAFSADPVGTVDTSSKYIVTAANPGTLTIVPQSINPTDPPILDPDDIDPDQHYYGGVTVEDPADVVYNGESQQQLPVVKDSKGNPLKLNKDYTLSYSADTVNVGTVTVTITGIGNYQGVFVHLEGNGDGLYTRPVTYKITPRRVTLTSEGGTKPYDGTPLTKPGVAVGGDGFVAGEVTAITATGTVTNVTETPVINTITYTTGADFKATNYIIEKAEGELSITKAEVGVVTVSGLRDTYWWTGAEREVTGFIHDGEDRLITVTIKDKDKAVARGTEVGRYYMGLKETDFTAESPNYYKVVVKVEDGYLDIVPINITVTVTVRGNRDTVTYDGNPHTVEGYEVVSAIANTGRDMGMDGITLKFKGDASVTGTEVGTYDMGLKASDFTVECDIYRVVRVVVEDGQLEITPAPEEITEPTEEIPDETVPLAPPEEIPDEPVPQAGPAWALINLILSILTVLASLLLLVGYFGKKEEEAEDENGNAILDAEGNNVMNDIKKRGGWRLASLVPAILSVIAFLLTENMRNPMILVDRWTLLMVVIAVVQVLVMLLSKKKTEENTQEA